ncbi:MAG: DHA2 family efflux MFS transporter permease subunit [Solirubrobacterales bacterium]|nr:DHA2 family efflux MFS transporter permease subunit [Solirubrobacterales bacterium]
MTRYRHLITDANAKWWTLGAMCFALFMIMLDNTVINVALPSIQRDLHASIGALEWAINGYTLSFGVLLVTGGRLGDIFGRRRMFLAGVAIFAITSATAGLAASPEMLIGSRVLQGFGAALMMPATLSIVTNAFSPAERGRAIGTWAGVSALALAIGPLLGGFLVEHVSWRAIFFINLPVAVIAIVATLFAVRESRDRTIARVIDFPGVAVLTTGLTAIVLALIEGNAWGWGSPAIVALLAGGALLLVAFVAVERRVRAPMVEFSFFGERNFLGSTAVAFIISFAMLGTFFFMAIYMQNVLGYDALEAGVRFLPTTLMIVLIAPLAGRLTDRIGPLWPIAAGMSILTVSMFMFAQIDAATTFADLLIPFILMGIGIAMTMSPMSTAAMNAVSNQKAGVASGILTMSRMVGGSVGIAASGAIFQAQLGGFDPAALATGGAGARGDFADALATAMEVSAVVVLLGVIISLATIRGRGSRAPAAPPPEAAERAPA